MCRYDGDSQQWWSVDVRALIQRLGLIRDDEVVYICMPARWTNPTPNLSPTLTLTLIVPPTLIKPHA